MSNRVSLGKTNAAILAGELDLTAWSDEELLRGQRRNKNGKWSGRKPKVVPKAIHDEWVKRQYAEAHRLMQSNLVGATNVLLSIANDTEASDADRLKAVGMLFDRVLGRAPEHIHVEVKPAWADALQAAIVNSGPIEIVSLDPGSDAVDAESWEDVYDTEADDG